MSDQARKQTDEELKKLERKIAKLYTTSQTEISEKWTEYMLSHEKKLNRLYEELEAAKKSGDSKAIKDAKEEYERAVKNVTLNNARYKAMLDETTAKLAHVNEVALGYINGDTPKIYTLNYNAFGDEDINGYTFALTNENAVRHLIMSDKINLPPKKLDVPKDMRWNAKNINSQLMQGILQGEAIPKIVKRLQNVTDMNEKSAVRSARTMVTEAENKGRQDSFVKATSDGVIMEREWVAAHDDRTRAWHLELHGVRVGVDEPWVNEFGEIMYPGDPAADPCNVYNCRCSIRVIVKGFEGNEEAEEVEEVPEPGEDVQFEEVKTKEEAYESLVHTFTDVDKSVLRLNEELLVDNVNQFNKLNSKFGVVKTNDGSYFSTNNTKHIAYANGGYRDGQYEISLSNKYYKKIDVHQESYYRGLQTGFKMPSSDDYKNTYSITHEYGHILEGYISRNRTDFDAIKADVESTWGHNPKFIPIRLIDAYDKSEKHLAKDIRKEIIDIAKSNNKDFVLDDNLSGYGKTNDFEFFAEVFANSQCGAPNELGEAMLKWLKKEGF